jgi:hypothetical protein
VFADPVSLPPNEADLLEHVEMLHNRETRGGKLFAELIYGNAGAIGEDF